MSDSEPGFRRSEHAEQRKNEGRPVASAYIDAQRATQNDIFLQSDGRYIVRGPRGREHIFEASGELITSLRRDHRTHLSKVRSGARYPISDAQFAAFKEIFK